MKKVVSVLTLVLCAMFVFSCATKKPATQKKTEASFKKVYDQYKGDLILEGATTYTVKSGDTLSAISREKYHNGLYFPVIMLASSDVVLDPDQISPGMVLTIPDLQKNLNNEKAKISIKKFLFDIAKIEDGRDRAADAKALRDLSMSL